MKKNYLELLKFLKEMPQVPSSNFPDFRIPAIRPWRSANGDRETPGSMLCLQHWILWPYILGKVASGQNDSLVVYPHYHMTDISVTKSMGGTV